METEDLRQWLADTSRLLKIGLRTHDTFTVDMAYKRISERLGEDFAEKSVYVMITHLMNTENWSFFDESGEPFGAQGVHHHVSRQGRRHALGARRGGDQPRCGD